MWSMFAEDFDMEFDVEIVNRFSNRSEVFSGGRPGSGQPVSLRESRSYNLTGEGTREQLEDFVNRVLADPVANRVYLDEPPALSGYQYLIDIRLKPGCLDLEAKTVMDFVRSDSPADFELEEMIRYRRLYLFTKEMNASDNDEQTMNQVLKEFVNPVIHEWEVVGG